MKGGKYVDLLDAARMKKVHPESFRKWVRQGLVQPADSGKPYVFSKEVVKNFKPRPVGRPRKIQFREVIKNGIEGRTFGGKRDPTFRIRDD